VCKPVPSLLDARGFIEQHIDLLLVGMQGPAATQAAAGASGSGAASQ
jgi:hypothetical protein